jgi:DnaJ-domain-containing protein 1
MTKYENRDYLELTYRSINCFSNDGKLDVKELDSLVQIALRDGVVDENEKRVLRNIIERLSDTDLTKEMRDKVQQLRRELDL